MTQNWPWGSQVADKKSYYFTSSHVEMVDTLHFLWFYYIIWKLKAAWHLKILRRSSNKFNLTKIRIFKKRNWKQWMNILSVTVKGPVLRQEQSLYQKQYLYIEISNMNFLWSSRLLRNIVWYFLQVNFPNNPIGISQAFLVT